MPDIAHHARRIEALYTRVLRRRERLRLAHRAGPWRITFDTNPDTCNLHCIMCEEHSPYSPRQVERRQQGRPRRLMPVALIRRVVADAAPHGLEEIIPSTMGEPLLYEDFEEILDICREHGVKLNLTTNGTFPRLGAKAWAERIVPVTSDVKFSWNGVRPETQERIMLGSRFARMVDNLRDFIAVRDAHAAAGGHRCRVTLQTTFLEENVEELPELVRFAARMGVDRVKGHHLWAHFDELQEQSMRRSPEAIEHWNRIVAATHDAADRHRLPDGRRVLLDNIFPLDPKSKSELVADGICPFLGQEAWVNAEGRFDPCCAPDAERRSLGSFGNLHETGLMDIWQGPTYRRLLQTWANRPLCLRCTMRRPLAEST